VSPGNPWTEQRLRRVALPVALAVAFLVVGRSGAFMSRVFLTMWVHESGHAVTAWLCGFFAFPGPWRTPVGEARNLLVSAFVGGGLVALGVRGYLWQRWGQVAGAAALLLLVALLTFGLRTHTAKALIYFGGDAGLFVLGSALMLSFYAAPGSRFHKSQVRWGFLVIGAFAFMDGLHTWHAARHHPEAIPYGEIEGVGLSDPSTLVDEFGWNERQMVDRYFALAVVCLLVLVIVYAWGALTTPREAADD
jgi:hypothetical protein